MKTTKILVTGIAALALGGSVAGAAVASGGTTTVPKPATAETSSTADTDNIQQGDQTGPDTPAGSDSSSAQEETETESSSDSDGPGGHQDPPGDVNHEFNGEE